VANNIIEWLAQLYIFGMDTELSYCVDRERTNYTKGTAPYLLPIDVCSFKLGFRGFECINTVMRNNLDLYTNNLEQCYKKYSDRL
jgi:hypothetical protein